MGALVWFRRFAVGKINGERRYKYSSSSSLVLHALYVVVRRRHESRHGRHEIVVISHLRHEKVIVIGICKAILYSLFYLVFWFDKGVRDINTLSLVR